MNYENTIVKPSTLYANINIKMRCIFTLPKEENNQQSFTAMTPMTHNNDQHGTTLRVQ